MENAGRKRLSASSAALKRKVASKTCECTINHRKRVFVTRLTVIDFTGQALFAFTNTTPHVIPAQWEWKDLQG
jgi:hypothetical protein